MAANHGSAKTSNSDSLSNTGARLGMVGVELRDLDRVEPALRDERAGDRRERKQRQQQQRGAHAGELPPGAQQRTAPPGFGRRDRVSGGRGRQLRCRGLRCGVCRRCLSSLRPVTCSRTTEPRRSLAMEFHVPVSSSTPTAMSSSPPRPDDDAVVPLDDGERAERVPERKPGDDERDAEAEAVDERSATRPAPAVAALS